MCLEQYVDALIHVPHLINIDDRVNGVSGALFLNETTRLGAFKNNFFKF